MDSDIRWTVRLPRSLRERLKVLAARKHRSLNGQLVAVVEEYLQREAPQEPFVEGRPANWESLSEDESPPLGTTWAEWARRRAERNG